MVTTIALPKLDGLQPTPHSTLLKLVEEAGELSRAILQLGQKPDDPTLLAELQAPDAQRHRIGGLDSR